MEGPCQLEKRHCGVMVEPCGVMERPCGVPMGPCGVMERLRGVVEGIPEVVAWLLPGLHVPAPGALPGRAAAWGRREGAARSPVRVRPAAPPVAMAAP